MHLAHLTQIPSTTHGFLNIARDEQGQEQPQSTGGCDPKLPPQIKIQTREKYLYFVRTNPPLLKNKVKITTRKRKQTKDKNTFGVKNDI